MALIKRRTGIPRSYREVREAVEELGYKYDYSTGGHDYFRNDAPSEEWGQARAITIPSNIKAEGTLRSILKDSGYFLAHNLKSDGTPLPKKKLEVTVKGDSILDFHASPLEKAWRKAVSQAQRSGSTHLPSFKKFEKGYKPEV